MNNEFKTIGLLGGMAWPSTQDYYFLLNREVERRLGANHSAKCIIYSYDFDSINPTYRNSEEITFQLENGIKALLAASADVILLCSNTTHKYLDIIREKYASHLFLDIRDCVGSYLHENNIGKCLLLGTKFTMSEPFYKGYIASNYKVNIMVPDENTQHEIHSVIFQELINNIVSEKAIYLFRNLIESSDVEAIILACTELRLVCNKISTSKIVIDSTAIHANAAVELIIKNKS